MAEEEEVAFDNWEDALDQEEVNKQPEETTLQEEKKEKTESEAAQSETKQEVKQQVEDPRLIFLKRLEGYKAIDEEKFQQYFDSARQASTAKQLKVSNQILKTDKDFAAFAKKVAKVFNDKLLDQNAENLDDDNLFSFFEENIMLIYSQLDWKSMEAVKDKLRIVKKEKKDQQIKAKKQKEKEERMKKQGKGLDQQGGSESKEKTPQDEIFGGAALVNSKQVEDELKKKPAEKVEAPKAEEEDDDDFM